MASPHIPTKHEVETFTGRYVDTQHPQPSTIALEDIAHALSQYCRYGGHCQEYYSVAEHAVFVSIRVERQGGSRDVCIAALHHDDAEAYLGDIPRPLKPLLGSKYVVLTDRMDEAIIEALNLTGDQAEFHNPQVKQADNWALFVEARHLLPSGGRYWNPDYGWHESQPSRIITPAYWRGGLSSRKAKNLYLKRHKELTSP